VAHEGHTSYAKENEINLLEENIMEDGQQNDVDEIYTIADAIEEAKEFSPTLKYHAVKNKADKLVKSQAMSTLLPRITMNIARDLKDYEMPDINTALPTSIPTPTSIPNPNNYAGIRETNREMIANYISSVSDVTHRNAKLFQQYDTVKQRQDLSHIVSLDIEQDLFSFGTSALQLRQASHLSAASDHEFKTQHNNLVINTVKAYMDVLIYRNLYQVSIEKEAAAKEILNQSEVRFKNLFITKSDVSKAKAEYMASMAEKEASAKNRAIAESRYKNIVGSAPPKNMAMVDAQKISLPNTINEFQAKAIANNTQIKAQMEQWNAARTAGKASILQTLPTAKFQSQFRKPFYTRNADTHYKNAGGTYDASYTINIQIPIYLKSLEYQYIKKSAYNTALNEQEYLSKVHAIDDKVSELWNTNSALSMEILSKTETVKYMQEAYDASLEQFKHGIHTLTETIYIQNRLFESKQSLIESQGRLVENAFGILWIIDELSSFDFKTVTKTN